MTRAFGVVLTFSCALGLALVLAGCYETAHCGPERCDGHDNDCDDLVDEGFLDAQGLYVGAQHCGSCTLACADVFPTAALTECVVDEGVARCELTGCPAGTVRTEGACVPETRVDCLPCDLDADCAQGGSCLPDTRGELHCLQRCSGEADCDFGYRCESHPDAPSTAPFCTPRTGSCSCTEGMTGAALACLVRSPLGDACVGAQQCEATTGLTECLPVLDEVCNAADEDCDGRIDEGFTDLQGRYLGPDDCGGCDMPCRPNGPHTLAECTLIDGVPGCQRECDAGFVDTDGLAATGCECELRTLTEVAIGQDGDCDGVTDPTPKLVFVSPAGDDDHAGTSVQTAVRTLQRGLALGASLGRTVLVARGLYEGPVALRAGANLIAGYRPDFRVRDLGLYPVLVENPQDSAGAPVLSCEDLDQPTRVAGLTVLGGDAADASQGSTAVYLDGCSDELTLAELTVLAGRAGSGIAGPDASERLDTLGFDSLAELIGVDGAAGEVGTDGTNLCGVGLGGVGGDKLCPSGEVSGGNGGNADCPDLSTLCVNGMPCGNAGCTDFTNASGVCDLDAAKAVALAHPAAQPGQGSGGASPGEATYPSVTNRVVCSFCDDNPSLPREGGQGQDGLAGDDGDGGDACSATEAIDLDSGLVRSRGGRDGDDGEDGGGGGGATAGAGRAAIGGTEPGCLDVRGGSGGGGGSGGCGAPGGGGGDGGGASIGVLVRLSGSATKGPVFEQLRVVTGSGGDGGDGGIGAAGGDGGAGGLGGDNQFFCARSGGRGGDGGDGGDGGGGGGGCGGGSYGVYVVGVPSNAYATSLGEGVLVERAGVAGRGGNAGFSPGHSGGGGSSGRADGIRIVEP